MSPVIRPARPDDWPAIWQLFQTVATVGDAFAYDETTPETVARKLWFDAPAVCYVVEDAGTVAGSYYIRPNQPGRGNHVANAGYIVAPSHRGQGLAKSMGVHSLHTARQLGYVAMQFNYVVSSNEAAVRAWERLGFTVIGRVPGAFRHATLGFVDVLILHRSLGS